MEEPNIRVIKNIDKIIVCGRWIHIGACDIFPVHISRLSKETKELIKEKVPCDQWAYWAHTNEI